MATYFGEVRPISSRAVDDEESDDQPKYNVFIEREQKTQSSTKLIIFSVGGIASVFVKSHFLPDNSSLICSVKYSCDKGDDDDSMLYTGAQSNKNLKKVTAASLFTSDSGVFICDIPKLVPDEVCYEVSESILKEYSPTEVLILTSKHMTAFRREDPSSVETPFLKSVGNSRFHCSYTCNIQRLEPPNFLCNIPASVLSHCEAMKLPALCIVNFVDTDIVDSINVETFKTVLGETIVSKLCINSDANARIIKSVKALQTIESNIYA